MQTRATAGLPPPHIVEIDENAAGKDYIIGDVHGMRVCLERVLAQLTEHDRLFIVGDLVDRGDDDAGVVELIMRQPAGKVYCVRGNHEDICLAAIAEYEATVERWHQMTDDDCQRLISSIERYEQDDETSDVVWRHLVNGGGWLIRLFKEELREGMIDIVDGRAVYQTGSRVAAIKHFFEGLPYIISVMHDYELGRLPFRIVHADLPLPESDFETKLIEKDYYLTPNEITYATWARDGSAYPHHEIQINDELHNFCERITYVGHTIVSDQSMAVRPKGNVVDTDIGTYAYKAVMLVNHTDRRAAIVGESNLMLDEVIKTVNAYLATQLESELIIAAGGGDLDQIAYLIKMGANPAKGIYVYDDNGRQVNAMMIAIVNEQHAVVSRFLQNGYDAVANDGMVFHFAVRGRMTEIVEIFLKERPDLVDVLAEDGYNALHWAVLKGWNDMARILLQHRASPIVQVGSGNQNEKNQHKDLLAQSLTTDTELRAMLGEAEKAQAAKKTVSVSQSFASTFPSSSGARAAEPQNDRIVLPSPPIAGTKNKN